MPKVRQSNFELLRIIAMLMVLAVHYNYGALGIPEQPDVLAEPWPYFGRILAEHLCIVCVNVFVLISGWFGIRASLSGGTKFLFQVFFIALLVAFSFCWIDSKAFSGTSLGEMLWGLWFVRAYAALFVLSPVLNAFVERASER